MKWSDGAPFNADAFVFWFEDIYSNKELLPSGDASMFINGKPGKVVKVDEVTVKYMFPDPYYLLADMLAGATPLGSQSQYGLSMMGSFAPPTTSSSSIRSTPQRRRSTKPSRRPASTTGST
jgi:ABC-type transport system substrate-binding protein